MTHVTFVVAVFDKVCFQICQWNWSDPKVLESIHSDLRESEEVFSITDLGTGLAKTLRVSWNTRTDLFTITISAPKHAENLTKRIMLSDISQVFDALGWFATATIFIKILIECNWEQNVVWDEQISEDINESWKK